MSTILDWFNVIAGFLGVFAFIWNVKDALASYLHLTIGVEQNGQVTTVVTSIDNKGRLTEEIEYAVLLIGPEHEDPTRTGKIIAEELKIPTDKIKFTNDIIKLRTDTALYASDGKSAIIPLPFFYSEQVRIGDESLNYRCSIDVEKLRESEYYSIRFFVFAKEKYCRNRLHRSTHDLFHVMRKSE